MNTAFNIQMMIFFFYKKLKNSNDVLVDQIFFSYFYFFEKDSQNFNQKTFSKFPKDR